jgi:hypothetical protein
VRQLENGESRALSRITNVHSWWSHEICSLQLSSTPSLLVSDPPLLLTCPVSAKSVDVSTMSRGWLPHVLCHSDSHTVAQGIHSGATPPTNSSPFGWKCSAYDPGTCARSPASQPSPRCQLSHTTLHHTTPRYTTLHHTAPIHHATPYYPILPHATPHCPILPHATPRGALETERVARDAAISRRGGSHGWQRGIWRARHTPWQSEPTP